jgi:hypothetical protein
MHAWQLYDDHLFLLCDLDSFNDRKQNHCRHLLVFRFDEMEESNQQPELHRDGNSLILLEG